MREVRGLKYLLGLATAIATLALAACATTSTSTSSQPMPVATTPEKLKADCWMKYENDPKMNLDKRATLVDACINEHARTGVPVN